jgi:glycosyltransferase involved in cell wall biosynthesis
LEIKVLQLGKAYPPVNLGGVEVVIQLLTEGLNKYGCYCDALGVNGSYTFSQENGEYNNVIYRTKLLTKAFSTLFSTQLISFLCKIKGNYDIIHIHSPDPMSAIALLLCRPKAKIVLHWHSDILKQKFLLFFYTPVLKWLVKRADLILATSPNYIDGSDYLKKNMHKVKVLPIGLNVSKKELSTELEQKLQQKYLNKKIIFSLGRLAYYKGFEYLVRAAKYLPDNWVVVIAGEGSEKLKLESIITDEGINNVILIGKISEEEKQWHFTHCKIFALSSIFKTEAFAIVQLEAMAYGKPIVSTEIYGSGVSWVNKNNYSGLIVPVKDSKSIAEAINKIIRNPELADRLSKGALMRYRQNFTSKSMIYQLLEYYNMLFVTQDERNFNRG